MVALKVSYGNDVMLCEQTWLKIMNQSSFKSNALKLL